MFKHILVPVDGSETSMLAVAKAAGLMDLADGIERFALAENLPGHAAAVTVRRPR